MLEFLGEHPLLSSFILLLLYAMAVRFGRLLCIVVRGWPPEHLDADGDRIEKKSSHE